MFAAVAALVAVGVDAPRAPQQAGDAGQPNCIDVRGEVRYGAIGYDHIVHLKNVCEETYHCQVRTDVNPEPIVAIVPPHLEVEVVTFRGSPARVFVPYVTCALEK